MNTIQTIFISIFGTISLLLTIKGISELSIKKNHFKETRFLFWLGIFVWGDAIILGIFWFLSSLICVLLQDWTLFLLIVSIFWVVRSFGEIIYWINQQFSSINRNPPKNLFGYRLFKNDSIWFVYQVFWQCIMVVSIISSIYFTNLWMNK